MNLNIDQFLDFIKNNSPKRFNFHVSKDKEPRIAPTEFWFENGKYYFSDYTMVRKRNLVKLDYLRKNFSNAQFHDDRHDFKYEEVVFVDSEQRKANAYKILEELRASYKSKLSPV